MADQDEELKDDFSDLGRELPPWEVRYILKSIARIRSHAEPVTHRGYDVTNTNNREIKKVTVEYRIRKIVSEEDVGILLRNGWTIVDDESEFE